MGQITTLLRTTLGSHLNFKGPSLTSNVTFELLTG